MIWLRKVCTLTFSIGCIFILTSCTQKPQLKWQALNSGSQASLRGVSAVNYDVIWASGSGNTILRSIDGGETWQRLAAPGGIKTDYRDIQAFDQNSAIVMSVGNGESSKLFKTIDGGKTWSLLYTNRHPEAFYNGMAFWNPLQGILYSDAVAGKFLVMVTHDGGESWNEAGRENLPDSLQGEHAYAASGTGITVAGEGHAWFATGGAAARVFKTEDYGKTWSVSETPVISNSTTSGIFSLAFYDTLRGIAVGGDYKRRQGIYENIAVTNDGGETWKLTKQFPMGLRSAVAYFNGQVLLSVGSHGTDYSVDKGQHWVSISNSGFYAFNHYGSKAWAVGSDGKIGRIDLASLL